jgi:hypothetical protein
MNGGHDADEKVQPDAVSRLQSGRQRLRPDARDARLTLWLVGERVRHIIRELTVDADRLQAPDEGFA